MLIGLIGDMVFEMGAGATIYSTDSGNLYLGMNDTKGGMYDNEGILQVKITR